MLVQVALPRRATSAQRQLPNSIIIIIMPWGWSLITAPLLPHCLRPAAALLCLQMKQESQLPLRHPCNQHIHLLLLQAASVQAVALS
jgi:hypothetical protein